MKKWLIIYDIRNPKRLQKVAKIMVAYAVRVQKSVFEMEATERMLNEVRGKVAAVMDPEKDFLVCFDICEPDWQKRQKYGPQKFEQEEEKPYYIY